MSQQKNRPDGPPISDHPHPHSVLRRMTAVLVALGLIGDVVGVFGLLALGVGLALPLLPLMAFFLAALSIPLLLMTVLHPRITVYASGLWIKPLLWRGRWVAWDAVVQVADHTLIQRGQRTRWEKPRDGRLITVSGGLPPVFGIVGVMAGLGRVRAFGISTTSHVDYTTLLNAIQRHKRRD
ncbi:MAG: hypothetical protein JXJ20_12690 [Anaerolineae bacterium]|nr:hypothetical protein [Anaerolineae bacterium]